jgi:peptide/nickel transport system substrate-binding protein
VPYHLAYSKDLGAPPISIWGVASPLDEVYWIKQPKT